MKRPRKRGDCMGGLRPCPYISCRWHMIWLHFYNEKKIKVLFDKNSDDEIVDLIFYLDETCVLDLADRGPIDEYLVGKYIGSTRQRVRQIMEDGNLGAIPMIQRKTNDELREFWE